MKSPRPLPLLWLSSMVLASVATAQNELWTRELGTSSSDATLAAAPDGSGGVYMCGYTEGSLGGPYEGGFTDAWLTRYDGSGDQLWIRQIGTTEWDFALAVAPDGSGGVYVCGWTKGDLGGPQQGGGDAWLARYDGAGNQLWILQTGGNSEDQFSAAAPDGSGGVYVSGRTGGSSQSWVVHYDPAGNPLWSAQIGYYSTFSSAVPDGSGGVFVSGHYSSPYYWYGVKAVLARYDSAGNLLWVNILPLPSSWDRSTAAALDGSGGVYLVGYTGGDFGGPNAGSWDAWIARYDGAGALLWTRQLGTSDADQALAATPDGAGGVYVSGSTEGSLGGPSAGSSDAWLAHYDDAGQQLWIRQSGTTRHDWAAAAAPDGSCGVYVSGMIHGNFWSNSGSEDAWLTRHACDLGTPYCTPAVPNSTGLPGVLAATGSGVVSDNDVLLIADQLPAGQFGHFLASQTLGLVQPPGSQGLLCLSGNIGRYNRIAEVVQGPTGSIQLDLTSIPVNPPQAVLPGDTWNFQCWYRDVNPTPTSNFTDAVSVTFQ